MFILHKNTKIVDNIMTKPIKNAITILQRDMEKILIQVDQSSEDSNKQSHYDHIQQDNKIVLEQDNNLQEEAYTIKVEEKQITIKASDDLGFVYGILRISKEFLGVQPFWFWMDQTFAQKESIYIEETTYTSPIYTVRFRGWFFNDEVLMMKWSYNKESKEGWKMCFEALLRCGGNMTIPGTDKMSHENRQMASDMGLWITHHHAEPLGAEMFVRVHPDIEPNYMEHADLFHEIWEEAVMEQKDMKVVWNLCFRGQGDAPFWSYDTTGQFKTPKKRGKMISDMIRIQKEIVLKHVKNPVFCTNLYGEIMELYKEGLVDIDEDIIKVRADNGYGKMVTRRRDNHTTRISSMPEKTGGVQGIYYHVSFYDLQAANHITMLPNSISFVNHELDEVAENNGNDFWVINCSNVRPHVYYLDAIRKKWEGREITDREQSLEFAKAYYQDHKKIAQCYEDYPKAMISYGASEDEHMGEQFYTENIRMLAHQILINKEQGAESLYWITGEKTLTEQVRIICSLCKEGFPKLESFYQKYRNNLPNQLFQTTLFLQAQIHYLCVKGVMLFGDAYEAYLAQDYKKAFVLYGNSAECFSYLRTQMRNAEYGVWKNFYFNDCFADIEHTAYMVRKVMSYVRELGDNARHDQWYHEFCYSKEDQGVFLLLVTDNHMTDQELYEVMRKA